MNRLRDSILEHIILLSIDSPVLIPKPRNTISPRQNLMAVCQRWKRVIKKSAVLWRSVCFLPDSSVHHIQLLNNAQQWIQRTEGSLVSVKFDSDYQSANQGSSPTETRQLMYGSGNFCFIQRIVMPCAHRITSLTCTVATNDTIRAFFCIPSGSLPVLEHMDVLLVNQYTEWISGFTADELATFTVFRNLSSLRILIIHLLNGIHPLCLQIPWTQLTVLDLGTRAIPPDVFRYILSSSISLVEACFLVKCSSRITQTNARPKMPKGITQAKLRVLNLLCTDPASQPEMFKRIKLPNLEGLRLENEDFKQGWKLDIYLPILRQAPLLQFLTLSPYRSRIPLIGPPPRHGLKHRVVPDREMTRFLKAIPSVVCLRLPLAININAFVVEELARGRYIPLLETLELGSLHGEHIVEMIHRRNYIVENTLLCSPVLGETSAMGASGRHSSTEASTPIRRISRLNLSVEEDEQVLAYVHHSLRAYQGSSSETVEVHITSHNPRLFYHPE